MKTLLKYFLLNLKIITEQMEKSTNGELFLIGILIVVERYMTLFRVRNKAENPSLSVIRYPTEQ